MRRIMSWLGLLAVCLVLVLACTALALRPDWRYLCVDALLPGTSAPLERLEEDEIEQEAWTLAELLEAGAVQDRSLMLINDSYHLPEDYEPSLIGYHGTGALMDEAMEQAFDALAQAVEEQFDQTLYIRSSYRTREEQAQTIQEDGEVAASLDASEHQAGLALDVCVSGYAGRAFLKTEAGQYVNDACWEYGFIIRYPYYGESSTGIGYEPWHIRYVGQPHAQIIMNNSWTLEDYFNQLEYDAFYRFEDVIITRQTEEPFQLPSGWESLTVSPDNQGGMIFTVVMPEISK